MNLREYKKNIKNPLKPRSIVFLMRDDEFLLGLKKTGFGKGYYLGIGGKLEQGETIEQAAIRELHEEINVAANNLEYRGNLNFYFPDVKDESWNQQAVIYISTTWKGEPKESEEIKPGWFALSNPPLDKMWDDAKYWLPSILKNETYEGDFLYQSTTKVIEYKRYV